MSQQPLKVLLLEDREPDARLVVHALEHASFDVDWQRVDNRADYIARLSPDFDLILADYNLPQFDALQALHLLQERDLDLPFIVVTGTFEEAAVECMRAGAADYLLKDRLARLGEAVRHALKEKQLREEQRQTAEALRESEQQLRLAIDSAHMGTWDWDIPADHTRYGGHFCELFGLPDEHSVSTYDELIQYVYHADRERVRQAVAQAVGGGDTFAIEFRVMHSDGNLRWLAGQGQVYRDSSGQPVRLSGIIQDITERKLGEEHNALLLELAASLSEALTPQQVADVIISRALDALEGHMGIIVLTGLDGGDYEIASVAGIPEEITEDSLRDTLRSSHLLSDTLKTGEARWIESTAVYDRLYPESTGSLLSATGSEGIAVLPLEVNQRTVGGAIIGFPEPRHLEEEDRAFLRALSLLCAQAMERARLYASEQAARTLAEEANELKSKFLAMVSHELRTPLTSITGFASTLLATDVTWSGEDQQMFLHIISEEADKLKELVEQLLDVSRLQAGALRIDLSPHKLSDVVRVATAQFRVLTDRHELVVDIPENLPLIMVDPFRLAQVLVNLVGNAVKHSPPGSTISITSRPDGKVVRVSVSDEGEGIPASARNYVFEAFRQVERKSQPGKGAGLGLAICKALIEAHGGKIWIEDRPAPG